MMMDVPWVVSCFSGDLIRSAALCSGKKWKQKLYRKHSGYPGGLKELTAEQVLDRDPARYCASRGWVVRRGLCRIATSCAY